MLCKAVSTFGKVFIEDFGEVENNYSSMGKKLFIVLFDFLTYFYRHETKEVLENGLIEALEVEVSEIG